MPAANPTPTPAPAIAAVALDRLKPILDHEMAPVLARGLLSTSTGGGLVIGVMDHGERAIFPYGVAKQGVARAKDAPYLYSNLGFGLLGYGLSLRAGKSYAQLLSHEITGPLRLSDTVVTLSPSQRARLLHGYNTQFNKAGAWDSQDTLGGARAIKSTANDMLTYLDANLRPDKYATGAGANSPAATLPTAMALDHQLRASVDGDVKIALAWNFEPKSGSYGHGGGTEGYSSSAGFIPPRDLAIVVLYNRDNLDSAASRLVDRVGSNIYQLMTSKPSTPVDLMSEAERAALRLRQSEGK